MNPGLIAFLLVSVLLALAVAIRPQIARSRGGKILAFAALFVLPLLVTGAGTATHLDHAKRTDFCLSCHVMEPYGHSLHLDDAEALPANHFQNRRIDRDYACYTCHTTYTMFGNVSAKLKGLRHVYVNYLGTIPHELELYEPYSNRECLHCHEGARSFEESELHADFREELEDGTTSCLECHEIAHPVAELDGATFWPKGAP